ncbi:uncharacterized protein LACBIDRAFT_333091 [Laccaria bicolor S238N-H82]|uniref:Predicted protein n=1 Tax=Laccaria bicolor (strain S238N-H82 / ATCC MYA-4686) TaxID=486041 RepID=B0DUU4_LACBS|nr:uncharacterized protein LACBIDRAFT_333091 [Laccaria bicolor S238N-H82]EDR01605.1 predicted protein [Laccaria bicolor S238N-H82]|eukprot:XP_001887681.1 predicted protein [Laccaria bicolor S238N-H82]
MPQGLCACDQIPGIFSFGNTTCFMDAPLMAMQCDVKGWSKLNPRTKLWKPFSCLDTWSASSSWYVRARYMVADKSYEKFMKSLNSASHLTVVLSTAFAMCAGPLLSPFARGKTKHLHANTPANALAIHAYSTNGHTSVTPSREKPQVALNQFFSTTSETPDSTAKIASTTS